MDLLAKRYPRYADKISSSASEDGFPVRGRRPRDHHRRATVVTYNPLHNQSLEYDDSGTMSDIEAPTYGFQRGSALRSSMPIVRSPPNTFEKPLGLVFLIYKNETKKAVLPNEITHLDTVRAMFVRSFPGLLSLEYMESPKRRIYILDPRTSIYYQLEDLRDIKDRTVLKVHECDTMKPQTASKKPDVRGRAVQRVNPRLPYTTQEIPAHAITTQVMKTQSLPPNILRSYPPPPQAFMDDSEIGRLQSQIQNMARYASPMDIPDFELGRPRSATPSMTRPFPATQDFAPERERSRTPEPRKPSRPQNLNYGRKGSPERLTTPDRLHSIPENRQIQNGYSDPYAAGFVPYQVSASTQQQHQHYMPQPMHLMPQPRSLSPPTRRPMSPSMQPPSRRAFSPPAVPTHSQHQYSQLVGQPLSHMQTYVSKSVRASTGISAQHAVPPTDHKEAVPPSRNSLPFVPAQQLPDSRPVVHRSQSYRATPERDPALFTQRPRSVTPQPMDFETKTRIDKMEVQLANLAHFVQTTVKKPQPSSGYGSGSGKPSSGQSSSSVASNSTGTFPSSTASIFKKRKVSANEGLSDIASDTTQQTVKQDIKTTISTLKSHADSLKKDLRSIRRIQQLNKESMQEQFQECFQKIKVALTTVPGAEHQPIRQRRSEIDCQCYNYIQEFNAVDKELSDLEASVEELRADVLNRQCRVSQSDVEGLALVLSHVTKCLGEMKVKFPALQTEMKSVMSGEMEIVVNEEKFLKEEPEKIDNSLKRCKKLTGTLFTLKRLSSVQEHSVPQVVTLKPTNQEPGIDEKKALLSNIQAMVPNHDARVESIKVEKTCSSSPLAADASRERKKKITIQQEALKFGRSLEIATKSLKPSTDDKKSSETSRPESSKPLLSPKPILESNTAKSSNTMDTVDSINSKKSESPKTDGGSNLAIVQPGPTVRAPVVVTATATISVPSFNKNNTENDYVKKSSENKMENVIPASENRVDNVSNSPESNVENSRDSDGDSLTFQKSVARAAFFSSLESPSSPPTDNKHDAFLQHKPSNQTTNTSPTKTSLSGPRYNYAGNLLSCTSSVAKPSSQLSQIPTYGVSKPATLVLTSYSSRTKEGSLSPSRPTAGALIRSQSNSSSIPRYQTSTESVKKKMAPPVNYDTKPKKVPPPPPPRKSSKIAIHGPPSPSSSSANGSIISPVRYITPAGSEGSSENKQTGNFLIADSSVCSSNIPMSSTPKTDGSQKPLTVFEKILVGGTYSHLKKSDSPEEHEDLPQAEVTTTDLNTDNNAVAREEREGSSESSTSSSSLDSQQGAVWVKRDSANGGLASKRPKPVPPQRKSSLVSKAETESESTINGDIKSKSSPSKNVSVS